MNSEKSNGAKVHETIGSHETFNKSSPVFFQLPWFSAFERHILTGDHNRHILTVTPTGSGRSILPMYSEKGKLGKALRSMANYYSPLFSAVSSEGGAVSAADLLLSHEDFFKGYDEVRLEPLLESQSAVFVEAFEKMGLRCFQFSKTTNWIHDEIESFEHFAANCSKKTRNNTRRAKNKLEKEGGFTITISCRENFESRLQDYHSIYADSWKQAEPHPQFINEIARMSAENDCLRLGIIYHNDFPVAAQMWFVDLDTAYIFKLAYRDQYASYSVGNILLMELCRHTIEKDGVNTVDFLTGNDGYKAHWMTKSRELVGLRITNPKRPIGFLHTMQERMSQLRSARRAE